MDSSKRNESTAETFARLFPWPADLPLSVPRFGKGDPSPLKPLPPPGNLGGPPRAPYAETRVWPDLGVTLDIQEESGPGGSELWAYVECTRPVEKDLAVVVKLLGSALHRSIRRSVKLDTTEGTGSSGKARLGTIAEVQEELGTTTPEPHVLLLVPSRPDPQPETE